MGNPFHSAQQIRNLLIQHEGGIEYCFVECIDCPARRELRVAGGTRHISDAEAIAHFNSLGWTVKPTRCPAWAKQAAPTPIEPAFGNVCEECGEEHVLLEWIGGLWRCPSCAGTISIHIKGG